MTYFIDIAFDNIHKYGEELCGDKVEVIRMADGVIIVLADGLGSGVKANILATLTAKIAGTMLKEGASIEETVDTVLQTLPVCKVRKLAYSTFTIIKVYNDGRVYTVEYDNPPYIFVQNGSLMEIEKRTTNMGGRMIKESNFMLESGDVLTAISDGVVHAGVGAILNLGWQWHHVAEHIEKISHVEKCAKNISKNLIETCMGLYANKPGDDSTAVTVKLRTPEVIDLFTGPPKDLEDDHWIVHKLHNGRGKKIVCGGTAANIVARELGEEVQVNMEWIDKEIPPTARIKGMDLVTEGVLTLSKAVEKIRKYVNTAHSVDTIYKIDGKDGASQLSRMLIEDCTHLNLWVGTAVNPAHQNPDFPVDLRIKIKVVEELAAMMEKLGKEVKTTFL
ncbi:translation initiation factor 2 beta subunit (eIF-2beta)/eIF-5 [Anaerosolibacter carboniphilus]|uniref:Translation initiation factor 2 beta subunit (eIF-2beta)/eIF-5 n=1 Tax=Anaerosolibacter carboniphilus TaxID=1417629 RepID=A0A841KTY1_9FIRM|nr:SpoIIE family protein phosphatase [Anaerosolibacter carboniphilus]MBB6216867.1 translation initiation factor 2 beta subunit (eIF-2beta)/eIF-5 [Anaerosolibacter carboniphilus]